MNPERVPMTTGEVIAVVAMFYFGIVYVIALRIYLERASSMGRIKYTGSFLRQVMQCFYEDLMLHCPWSREVSIRYRMKHLFQLAHDKPWGKFENSKGVWTCEELQKADQSALRIAADGCFVSRTQFWFSHLLAPSLIIPYFLLITVLGLITAPLYYLYLYLFNKPRFKEVVDEMRE